MKIRQNVMIRVFGSIWLGAGLMLMMKGIPLLVKAAANPELPLIGLFLPLAGSAEQAAMILVVLGLFIGLLKGKTVITKAARKAMLRVRAFPDPFPVSCLYAPRNYILIVIMMGLGMVLRFFSIPVDVHGLIDLAVGSALVIGAMTYFREGQLRSQTTSA